MSKIVAVTACPTGIAHTFMAAEALAKAAKELGHEIKVETMGSVGVENGLTASEIKLADVVIIAADTKVDTARFAGKKVYTTYTGAAIKDAREVIGTAFKTAVPVASYLDNVATGKEERSAQRKGAYKHLMTGVSYMLPLVVAGGLAIALSFVFGIKAFEAKGTMAAALMDIGGGAAFALMVPILAAFIAFSIADRPGLTPGLIGGMLAAKIGAGFLGGIVAGFIAGYIALWLKEHIQLPKTLEGLKPILIIPLVSSLAVGLLMIYVIGTPVKAVMDALTAVLKGMTSTNAAFLGLILGAMMAFDMGGPVNKAAYTFAVGLLGSNIYEPMAAVMAAGMTPPLGLALATFLGKSKYTVEEREAGKAAAVLGISFITEGAIPFAAADPFRVIPAIMAGSAVTGALSMMFNSTLRAPHGGIFVLPIPNAVGNLGAYILAIVVGTVLTAVIVNILKPNLEQKPHAGMSEHKTETSL
jgi:fructose PTS system EIIBC or EIIC component